MVKSTALESLMAARYPPYSDAKVTLLSSLTLGLPTAAGSKFRGLITVCSAAWSVLFKTDQPKNNESKL